MRNFVIIIFVLLASLNIKSAPLGEYFTYQGELYVNSLPANGNYDLSVNLYETQTGGISIGGDLSSNTSVVNGIFSFEIDIGSIPFMGDEVWLELSVKPAGTGSYTDLPRQKITNSPYAIHAQFVGSSGVDSDAIQTGSVTSIKIADGAITQTKLQSSSVGTLQVINASITEAKLADNSVTTTKLANDSVTTDKIGFRAVTAVKIAADSIVSANIVDGTIINSDIAQGTITTVELANDSVTHNDIRTSAVRTEEIQDGTIVAADINSASVQQRVTGVCSAGSSIQSILENGTVTCETDDVGTNGWGLTGNAGTNPASNFIGTTDNQPFVIKVNNKEVMYMEKEANSLMSDYVNLIFGGDRNYIDKEAGSRIESIGILSGDNNRITTNTPTSASLRSVISGGVNNLIEDSSNSSITGGYGNHISSGGESMIAGGAQNEINSSYGFASGYGSKVNHRGGWVWNDYSDLTSTNSLSTTDMNQFLIRAEGGFGLGTNAPASPMHIKGLGKTFGALIDEVVMIVEPKVSTSDVSLAINKLDSSKEAALVFTTNKFPDFDIRAANGDALDFNSYQSGSAKFMMRIQNSDVDRIDFNTNLEPQSANAYNFGSSAFRWKHIYTEDITTRNTITTDSDRRLKDHIKDIDYGLADILSMRPVSYQLKKGNTEQTHLGFIAQEIKAIIPEIVSQTEDEKHMLSMRYSELIPILIKATQEQQILIDQQSEQIKALAETNALLIKHLNTK